MAKIRLRLHETGIFFSPSDNIVRVCVKVFQHVFLLPNRTKQMMQLLKRHNTSLYRTVQLRPECVCGCSFTSPLNLSCHINTLLAKLFRGPFLRETHTHTRTHTQPSPASGVQQFTWSPCELSLNLRETPVAHRLSRAKGGLK